MYVAAEEGRLQVIAAVSLLEFSGLVRWDCAARKFIVVPSDCFESSWKRDVDPVFGRLICWIIFSTGAEFLLKGLCLLHGAMTVKSILPHSSGKTGEKKDFSTLKNRQRWIKELCKSLGAGEKEKTLLLDAYDKLNEIRTRDVHAYVPNQRVAHHHLVQERFAPCFDLLVSWLSPGGTATLNVWRDEAAEFIANLELNGEQIPRG